MYGFDSGSEHSEDERYAVYEEEERMEAYEKKYGTKFASMRYTDCRCVRNRRHPGKKKARREYLISGKWYPAAGLPEELVEEIEADRDGIEVTSDEDASSDEEPVKQPKPTKQDVAKWKAEEVELKRRRKAREAEWKRRRKALEAERATKSTSSDVELDADVDCVILPTTSHILEIQEAHEAAVAQGDPAHCDADDEYYRWTVAELKELLQANRQLKGGSKPALVARCSDGKLYGALPRCPKCSGGRLKVLYDCAVGHGGQGFFRCPGEWIWIELPVQNTHARVIPPMSPSWCLLACACRVL